MNKLVDKVPDGYALISIDALKAWGKYDEVRNACQFSAEQAEQEPLDDDARDNMLLWMIQRHFPSLPLSDEHTDWGRWLGFANAVFEAGRKDAAPVRTKDLTDVEDLQDAMTKALKKAFQLGQTYFQQADSESYAANKRADITLELYRKLEDDTRSVIATHKEKNK